MAENEKPNREPMPDPEDPMLGPLLPYTPEDYGLFPELLDDHRNLVEETMGDQVLLLLVRSKESLERLRGTAAQPTDYADRLRSFEDRIHFRKTILGGS